mgnify:CR=1 FL=1|tara:strand:+ start:79 stop:315 length:237 start_codon:yes stop_codon:yes gene_type:complete
MIKPIATTTAVVALISAIGGGVYALDSRYAQVEMVAGNAQQIAVMRIENAKQSGNKELLRRLCDDFYRIHKWQPSACK